MSRGTPAAFATSATRIEAWGIPPNVRERRVGPVAPREDRVGGAPLDPDVRVVPRHAELVAPGVGLVHQVLQQDARARVEAVRDSAGDEEAARIVRGEVDE